ncbi:hypothetical protein KC337_g9378, partial [Hortaea werneckii]
MGIHGLLRELRPAPRTSLALLSSDHYTTHSRPLRLAIDISIWLFQIQSGKGGSNPALRTFYYRLLRLLTLNIHPLFVFDGPNKPVFKRNKKVGGPGVKVASVPEFLAKQLLKQFGFPWHVAPGEAEAECAVLQREGLVDAVLSEDVDTLMFGCGVTLRSWNAEGAGTLREFAKDAFDWRCITGARKFIRNLAPAMLVRELRLRGERAENDPPGPPDHEEAQKEKEENLVKAIHGTRTHPSVDSTLELRISFIPSSLVPLDLSLEEEDEEVPPASQTPADDHDNETLSPASDSGSESLPPPPTSPTKKRNFKPYDPDLPEKIWILKPFLQLGCPLLVEDWEASSRDPKAFLKQRRKAREVGSRGGGAGKGKTTARGKEKTREVEDLEGSSTASSKEQRRKTRNAAAASPRRNPLAELSRGEVSGRHNSRSASPLPHYSTTHKSADSTSPGKQRKGFIDDDELRVLSPAGLQSGRAVHPSIEQDSSGREVEILDLRGGTTGTARPPPSRPPAQSNAYPYLTTDVSAAAAAASFPAPSLPQPDPSSRARPPRTVQPHPPTRSSHQATRALPSGSQSRKSRRTPDILSRPTSVQPSPARSQRSIVDYYSPSPRRKVPSNAVAGRIGSGRVPRPDLGNGTAGNGDRKGERRGEGKVVVDLLSSSPSAPISPPRRQGSADVEGRLREHTTQAIDIAVTFSSASEGEDVEMRDPIGSPTPRRRKVEERELRSRNAGFFSTFASAAPDEDTSLRRKFVRCSGPYGEEEAEQTDVTPRPSRRVGGAREDGGDEDGVARFSPGKLPDTVTKRRKKGLRKKQSNKDGERKDIEQRAECRTVEVLDLAASPLPTGRERSSGTSGHQDEDEEEEDLPSPSSFLPKPSRQVIPREKAVAVDQMDGVHEAESSSSYPTPPSARDEEDRERRSMQDSTGAGLSNGAHGTRSPVENVPSTRPTKRSQPSSKTPSTISHPNPSVRRSPRHHQQNRPTPSTVYTQPPLPSMQTTKPFSNEITPSATDESYPTTTTATATSSSSSSQPPPTKKKKAFQLRASLEGSWKEIDLTGDGSGFELSKATFEESNSTTGGIRDGCADGEGKAEGKGKWWRKSGVEVLAFSALSTGVYGYPSEEAAEVAVQAVRGWLDEA